MAAPVLVGTPGAAVASPSSVPSPTTLTPSTGSGYAAGDLLLCFTALWGGFGATVSMSAGWTPLVNTGIGTPPSGIALFGKIAASASEPAPNVVWNVAHSGSGGDPSMAQIAAFRGAANVADVVGAVNTIASTFSQSAGGSAITTLTADDRVFSLTVHGGTGGNTLVAPSGFAMVATGVSTTSGITMTMGWASQAKAVPGSVGIPTFGFNGSSAQSVGVMMALKAAPVGIINNDVVTGAIGFTGTLVETWRRTFTDASSGSLALNGIAVDRSGKGFSDIAAGALLLSGVVAAPSRAYTDARAGTLVLTGTSVSKRGRSDFPSGSIALNGAAVDSWTKRTVYSDAPTGAIGITGTKTGSRRGNDSPSGRLVATGTVVSATIFHQTVTGNLRTWGWAAETLPSSTPRPVGIPGVVATSAKIVVSPTILTPPMPGNYQVGDLLLCFAGGDSTLLSVSAGWTVGTKPDVEGQSPTRLYLVGKVAASLNEQPPTLTFTAQPGPTGDPSMARIVAFRNVDTRNMAAVADVVGDANQDSSVWSAGGAAITTTLDNDLVLSLTRRSNDYVTAELQPAGFGMLTWDYVPLTGSNGISTAWAYQVKRVAGLVPAPQFVTGPNAVRFSTGVMVALKGIPVTTTADTPAGTLGLTGSLVERKGKNDKPTGAISLSGTVVEQIVYPWISGTIPLTGTVQESWNHVGMVTGTLALSGSAVAKRRYTDTASGAISISGTAIEQRKIADKCAGVLKLFGVLSQSLSVSTDLYGNVRLTGKNSEFIVIDETIYYDDFPGGLLEIDGKTVLVDYTPEPGRDGRIVTALGPGRVVRSLETGRVVGNLTGRLT